MDGGGPKRAPTLRTSGHVVEREYDYGGSALYPQSSPRQSLPSSVRVFFCAFRQITGPPARGRRSAAPRPQPSRRGRAIGPLALARSPGATTAAVGLCFLGAGGRFPKERRGWVLALAKDMARGGLLGNPPSPSAHHHRRWDTPGSRTLVSP